MDKDLISLIREFRAAVTTQAKNDSLSAVIEHIYPKIFLYFLARVSDPDAQDLCSETVIDIHKGLRTFKLDTTKAAWGWCYTIAKRKLAKFFDDTNSSITEATDPTLLAEINTAATGNMPSGHPDLIADIMDRLLKLRDSDPDCFFILWDCYIVGLSYEEIAQKNEKTYNAVRQQTKRCAQTLK